MADVRNNGIRGSPTSGPVSTVGKDHRGGKAIKASGEMLVNLEERADWKPLMMAIVNVVLIGTSLSLMIYSRMPYSTGNLGDISSNAGIILGMLTIIALLVSLILLLNDNLRTSKSLLTIGILLLIVSVVIRALDWVV